MRTIKISALTIALLAATTGEAEAVKNMRPPKNARELSSESVSASILFVLMLPAFLARAAELQRHASLYEARVPVPH